MIKLTLKDGQVVKFYNAEQDLNTQGMLEALFDGECSAREGEYNAECTQDYIVLNDEIEFPECYVPVIKAKWDDTEPDTTLHEYVLDRLNAEGVSWAFAWAEGSNTVDKPISVITEYFLGFEEAVNIQINLDGLDFVIGNHFCLSTLLDLVVREIVRQYLREVDLY